MKIRTLRWEANGPATAIYFGSAFMLGWRWQRLWMVCQLGQRWILNIGPFTKGKDVKKIWVSRPEPYLNYLPHWPH